MLPGDEVASIERAVDVLLGGGLVGMPTETVYGLAAWALDERAVAKVFEAKGRPSFDPLIVHVATLEQADHLAHFNAVSRRLAEAFWPGPLTLVLARRVNQAGRPIVPDLVTAGLDSVGLRMPDHRVARMLLASAGVLAAPSANRFGSISPTTAQHVVDELGDKVGVVLDGGPCTRGVESTVVRVSDDGVEVLRLGALAVEAIEQATGAEVRVLSPTSSPGKAGERRGDEARPAPGMTDRHYAPGTAMRLVRSLDEASIAPGERVGLVGVGLPTDVTGFAEVRDLSASGDLNQAAAGLFRTLRELDAMGLDRIIALAVAERGIGRAINDRLRRGSVR